MATNQQTSQAPPADNAKDIRDNKTTSSKKLKTGEVKDQISKGSTMVGKTPENPSGKPDVIEVNPMQNEGILSQLNAIYDRVLSELDTHLRDDGTTSLTNTYKKDTILLTYCICGPLPSGVGFFPTRVILIFVTWLVSPSPSGFD